jgi:hypothetical protein
MAREGRGSDVGLVSKLMTGMGVPRTMKRILLILVAVLTFCIGSDLTSLKRKYFKSNRFTPTVNITIEKKSLLDGLRPTARACGEGYSQGYQLPDGKKLGEGNSCYGSFKEAKKQMKIWLQDATRIIETVAPPKSMARSKSERVVASFPTDEFGNDWVRIMWTEAGCIHWIAAPDLDHALALEKSQFNPYKFEESLEQP